MFKKSIKIILFFSLSIFISGCSNLFIEKDSLKEREYRLLKENEKPYCFFCY